MEQEIEKYIADKNEEKNKKQHQNDPKGSKNRWLVVGGKKLAKKNQWDLV